MNYINAYAGYIKKAMHISDQKHTSFITDLRLYCYQTLHVRSEERTSYLQRLINSMFKD